MAGRKHLFSESPSGDVLKVKVDPKNIKRQVRAERAAGRKPVVLDDDELINYGLMQHDARRRGIK